MATSKTKQTRFEIKKAIAKDTHNATTLIQDEVEEIYSVMRTNKSISGATWGALQHHIGNIVRIASIVTEEAVTCANERDMFKEGGKLMKLEADKYKTILGEIQPDKSATIIRKVFKKH